jgi:hypothetical protein
MVDAFLEAVTVFEDHLEVKIANPPALMVRLGEVGLRDSESVGVGGPTRSFCYQRTLAAHLIGELHRARLANRDEMTRMPAVESLRSEGESYEGAESRPNQYHALAGTSIHNGDPLEGGDALDLGVHCPNRDQRARDSA